MLRVGYGAVPRILVLALIFQGEDWSFTPFSFTFWFWEFMAFMMNWDGRGICRGEVRFELGCGVSEGSVFWGVSFWGGEL